MSLFDHLETYLGECDGGRKNDADGIAMPFQVASFPHVPLSDTYALCTLGLSNVQLPKPDGTLLRFELIVFGHAVWFPRSFPGILQDIGMEAIDSRRAFLPGHIIGPRGPLCTGASVSAFFVCPPVFLEDSFHQYNVEQLGPVIIAALIPITLSEVDFLRREGSDRFEDLLVEADPGLARLCEALGRVTIISRVGPRRAAGNRVYLNSR